MRSKIVLFFIVLLLTVNASVEKVGFLKTASSKILDRSISCQFKAASALPACCAAHAYFRIPAIVNESIDASKHERHKPLVTFHIVFICWAKEANAFGLIRLGCSKQTKSGR